MITVFEYMEDFDNRELSDYEWKEKLMEACREYNEIYGTNYKPSVTVIKYTYWLESKIDR